MKPKFVLHFNRLKQLEVSLHFDYPDTHESAECMVHSGGIVFNTRRTLCVCGFVLAYFPKKIEQHNKIYYTSHSSNPSLERFDLICPKPDTCQGHFISIWSWWG